MGIPARVLFCGKPPFPIRGHLNTSTSISYVNPLQLSLVSSRRFLWGAIVKQFLGI
jgi:hypothetical protein